MFNDLFNKSVQRSCQTYNKRSCVLSVNVAKPASYLMVQDKNIKNNDTKLAFCIPGAMFC